MKNHLAIFFLLLMVRFPYAQNVGIGTTNPTFPLTIRADENHNVLAFRGDNDAPKWHWWMPGSSLDLSETGVADHRLHISAVTGNVGIGCLPSAKLEVSAPAGDEIISKFTSTNTVGKICVSNDFLWMEMGVGDSNAFIGTTYGDMDIHAGAITRVFLQKATGFVGINTSSPSKNLDVNGDANINGQLTVNSIALPVPTAVSFQNGFSNYGGVFENVTYVKDMEGFVHLSGMVQIPNSYSNGTIFVLPAGFIPDKQNAYIIFKPGGFARLDINNSGNVILEPGNSGIVSLSGISFRADH
ncbi:MAG TPA: hypothetical protein VJ508_08010 [Saprospiraceae bacterium]|nr:hypothetical protein [Saprospiraceae bacterium]